MRTHWIKVTGALKKVRPGVTGTTTGRKVFDNLPGLVLNTSTHPKLGVYKNFQSVGVVGDSQYTQSVLGYEAWLGRKVDYVLEFQETKDTDDHLAWPSYMSNYYTTTKLGTRKLSIGATLSSRSTSDYYTRQYSWQQLADGAYDSVWTNMGTRLVASGQKDCILRGPHEFNIQDFLHRVMPGEETAFIAAWRRWHGKVRAAGFTGLITFNPVSGDYRTVDASVCYPGDAYVDLIDLDLYDNWYDRGTSPTSTDAAGVGTGPRSLTEQQNKWNEMVNGWGQGRGLAFWRNFAVTHNKGMAFSEWGMGDYFNDNGGLNHGGGDNAWYVEKMSDFILDPNYPPGSPGGVVYHAFWEHAASNGVQPNSAANPDSGRSIPVPKARAAFLARFGGSAPA